MVHPGRPSNACATCKARKIKCDEEKPACTQCRKSSRICPGYVDVIFRNQTDAITKKQQKPRRSCGRQRTTSQRSSSEFSSDQTVSVPMNACNSLRESRRWSRDLVYPVYQLHAHTRSQTIRPPPWFPMEEQAVNICFKNFDVLYGKHDAHNLLLSLAPLYGASFEDSPLRTATQAAALSAIAKLPSKRDLQHEAIRVYSKAVVKMAKALKDPEQARSNETLLATLLLSWYETISSSDQSMQAWSSHIEGATALVTMRGSAQFYDPLGLCLFRAIRTETFINCLRTGKTLVDFPELGGWSSDTYIGLHGPRDPVAHIMQYAAELPALRERHRSLIAQEHTPSANAAMLSLLQEAQILVTNLSEYSLPDRWRPSTTGYVAQIPDDVETAPAWAGPVHDYPDIYTASALNKLRSCRLLLAKLILVGLTWLYPQDYLSQPEYHQAVYIEQQATDEICSSVPAHFGWGSSLGERSDNDQEMQTTANLIAGYLLHWPLRVARRSVRIDSHQRAWIDRQLCEVAERCGVHQAAIMTW